MRRRRSNGDISLAVLLRVVDAGDLEQHRTQLCVLEPVLHGVWVFKDLQKS